MQTLFATPIRSTRRCACAGCVRITLQPACDQHRLAIFEPVAADIVAALTSTAQRPTADERTTA